MNGERSVYKNSFWPSRHASQYAERLIIHSRAKALHLLPSPPLSDPTETPAPPSRLHKLYNVQCRNKVDHLRAICLFSYLAKFSFHLPPPLSHSLSRTGFPLNFYDHSRREWRTAGTTMIENGDGDIGIPLTFANYTPKIDSPVVHIEKFSRDSTNLRGGIAIESHGLIASLSHECWRYLGAERRENRSKPRIERTCFTWNKIAFVKNVIVIITIC